MHSVLVFRCLGAIALGLGGWGLGALVNDHDPPLEGLFWVVLLPICGVIIGFGLVPYPPQRVWRAINRIPGHVLFGAFAGLTLALVFSAVLALPLSLLPGSWGEIAVAITFVILAYFGIGIMVLRGRDILRTLGTRSSAGGQISSRNDRVILDTNSIIDGRIADIVQTGFVHGTLVIPKFVLDELHYVADSSDPLRRTRGRRGLDILTKLQRETDFPVQISETDFEGVREVDAKLVELAKLMHCPIITNDVNLNRVASLQGVRVLNINELAHAIKPIVLPNEEMRLKIVQEGKEHGQGIGYLDDGTMVVVEGGRRHIGNEITVVVSRVLQTGAGRMIFAQPRA